MTEQREKTTQERRIRFHEGPPPDLGRVIHEREIPSDVALVTPLIIRVTEFLLEENVVPPDFKNKFQLCLDEALRNAIIHGNRKDFSKKVRLRVFLNDECWRVMVEDEGTGFSLEKIPDPLTDVSLWGEGGRGIHLMEYCMDGMDYYQGGRALVMTKFL